MDDIEQSTTEEDKDNDLIEDGGAEYSPKSEFSKPSLVFQAMQKCIQLRSEEMKPGYFNFKFDKEGHAIKIWVPDARQKYIGSVEALRVILNPECNRSKDYKNSEQQIADKLSKLFNKYCYKEIKPQFSNSSIKWIETGHKYIPLIDSSIKRPHPRNDNKVMYITGFWNNQTNQYLDECIEIYDELLAILNDLIDKLNYFKQGVSF